MKKQTHIFHAFRGVSSNKFLSKMQQTPASYPPTPFARIWTFGGLKFEAGWTRTEGLKLWVWHPNPANTSWYDKSIPILCRVWNTSKRWCSRRISEASITFSIRSVDFWRLMISILTDPAIGWLRWLILWKMCVPCWGTKQGVFELTRTAWNESLFIRIHSWWPSQLNQKPNTLLRKGISSPAVSWE